MDVEGKRPRTRQERGGSLSFLLSPYICLDHVVVGLLSNFFLLRINKIGGSVSLSLLHERKERTLAHVHADAIAFKQS